MTATCYINTRLSQNIHTCNFIPLLITHICTRRYMQWVLQHLILSHPIPRQAYSFLLLRDVVVFCSAFVACVSRQMPWVSFHLRLHFFRIKTMFRQIQLALVSKQHVDIFGNADNQISSKYFMFFGDRAFRLMLIFSLAIFIFFSLFRGIVLLLIWMIKGVNGGVSRTRKKLSNDNCCLFVGAVLS